MGKTKKKNLTQRFLDVLERVGNKLPHPVTIFLILSAIVVIVSHIAAKTGVSVTYEGVDTKTKEVKMITTTAISLLTPEGIRYMFTSFVTNFTGFAPLGTVLVALLGVGLAEGSGLISALIRKLVLSTPKRAITVVIVFAGVISNIASDVGYIVLIPLGAIIFMSFGRHPIAGMAAAFAGVSGGFSANISPGPTDALLAGISQEAVNLAGSTYQVSITGNWYFLAVSTVLITILGTIVTEKIIEPRLGEYKGEEKEELKPLSKEEKRGLSFSGIAFLITVILIAATIVPYNGILRDPKTHEILKSPFMSGIVVIIMIAFLIPGIAYGVGAKTIKNDGDVAKFMSKAISGMGGYIVLVAVAAQFVAYFGYSNLGTIVAVKGADFLKNTGMTGISIILGLIGISAFINLFMGSASAKWAIMAPIFVPMFMQFNFSPEFTQVAYRVGDSTTNIISPLMSYFAFVIAYFQKYDKDTGVGTIISTMLPYTIVFLIGWTALLVIWFYLGLPIGPGVEMMLP
ncbi:AbgT family transporter [Clostridium sp.]|uniref:AbgT family transporter n=1 Tax=Clostridium sp. TaxID=1506 RepID=UPI003463EF41